MKSIRISAKKIVEFLYSGGDLTNEYFQNTDMLDGTKAHQFLQSKYNEDDKREVSVETFFDMDNISFHITGRIDGVLKEDGVEVIEEIKSTKTDLAYMDIDSRPQHLMQVKMYAYMYLLKKDKKSIRVRLRYIHLDSYETKYFDKRYNFTQLSNFFIKAVREYLEWYKKIILHDENRQKSIVGLNFPFESYRDGQRDLMAACYKTVLDNDILYAIAPTGIGKTIATLFSSLKAINGPQDKVFYLTAKNVGKKVVLNTVELLEESGLVSKSVEITSKDSICFLDETDCNPESCKYAKGFFNRLYRATTDIFNNKSIYRREVVEEYAKKHTICPFEFSLYLSYYSDIVICDYNYAFCPRTHLKRYFDFEEYKPILLVDEAHNLISRSRDMYSASLDRALIQRLIPLLKKIKPSAKTEIKNLLNVYEDIENEIDKRIFVSYPEVNAMFLQSVKKLQNKLDKILNDNQVFPTRKEVINIYFELFNFNKIYEYYNESFVFMIEKKEDNNIVTSINCLDASKFILDSINRRVFGTVFFSATMFPLDYYKQLLTVGTGNNIQLSSPFKQEHLDLITIDDTSTRYKDRDKSIDKIIGTIYSLISGKKGNYIVFFPSYAYMNKVLDNMDLGCEDFRFIIQKRNMSNNERNQYLKLFEEGSSNTQVAFFVMGGMFAEGIDYIGDMLNGVLIVGVCLPMYGDYNNLLKSHFDNKFKNGFDYAYTYPGLNKVIQAVGRVIRTKNDRGVAILFDDRFSSYKYKVSYPIEWNHRKTINDLDEISNEVKMFWSNK